ncbi:MAG: DUF2125 domain-containing protein [Magnetovibrio sp.]|nr:DUF2125 domain-containing protein [Magnetovibrio sp.]
MAKHTQLRHRGSQHPAMHYQKPKGLKRFQLMISLIASAALAFGLWAFAWYAASAWVKAEITDWVDLQRSRGAVVNYTKLDTTGFPSAITVIVTDPVFQGAAFGRALSWKSDQVRVSAKPWMPWRLNVVASGKHDLSFDDGAQSWRGVAEYLSIQTVLGGIWPQSLDLDVRGLTLGGTTDVVMEALRLKAQHDPDTQVGGTGLALSIVGSGLSLPGVLPQPLGPVISVVDIDARVTGAVIPDLGLGMIPHWQSSGGMVKLDRVKFRSDPVGVAAGGTVSLTKELQPEGALTAKIEGLFQMMEILRAKGYVSDGNAIVATMALSALSKRPPGGGPASINVSVTVQDGMLSLGPLKVMKMPKFNWGLVEMPAKPSAPPKPPEPRFKKVPDVF